MAKYRELTSKELETLEKEFVDYLVVNGITADDWVRLKEEEVDKAEKVVSLFSDVVFEGVLRKIEFLDIKTKNYIQSIQCLSDKMIMVAVNCIDKSIDLSEIKGDELSHLDTDKFEIHTGEKEYNKSREEDLFQLTEKGYQITSGEMFKKLILATV